MTDNASRFNDGKVDLTLVPWDAMEAEARVWMAGEEKYGHNEDGSPNWTKLWGDATLRLCMACAYRHMAAIQRGELLDPESGQHHAAHVRCNMAMIIRQYNTLGGRR